MFVFYLLNSLYILDINILSDIQLVRLFFSPSVGCFILCWTEASQFCAIYQQLVLMPVPQTPKHSRPWPMPLVILRNFRVKPYCWRHHTLAPQNPEKSSCCSPGTHPQCQLSLCSASYQKRKGIMSLTHLWTLRATLTTAQCSSGMGSMGGTNHILIGFKSHCAG